MSVPFVTAALGMVQEFGRGFSQKPSGKLATAFGLSWSHCVFLSGVKNSDERQLYEIESAQSASIRKPVTEKKGGGDAAV